ncbi:hypothetical protein K8I61_00350 [bacterium]|nr:hypothetical protein [bacterium]
MRLFIAVAIAFAATFAAIRAHAQTNQAFEEYGVGPRDAAMGNAYTAVADDFAAAFYNPAGLYQTEGANMTFGWKYLQPELTMKMPGFDEKKFTDFQPTSWFLYGFTWDLHAPRLINPKVTDRVSFGVAFAISEYVHSYSNYYDEHTPYFFRYQDRPVALLSLYIAGAFRITDWLAVGGGVVIAPSYTYIDARVRTDIYLPDGRDESTQGLVNRSYSIAEPVLGVIARIPVLGEKDGVRVGLSWRDEVKVIDGKGRALNRIIVHAPGDDGGITPTPPQDVPVTTLSGFSPMQATAGVSVKAWRGALLANDTIYKRWSRFKGYFLTEPDPKFGDTLQNRTGVEQSFFPDAGWIESWSLRAGGYYEPSPVPSQDGVWNFLDNDKTVVSAGGGVRIGDVLGVIKTPVDIDANVQVHLLADKTIQNDNDPSFPEIETGGALWSGAIAAKLTW